MIQLDLKTALPKIREAWDTGRLQAGTQACRYSAPCAVGAALTPDQLNQLVAADYDRSAIDTLVRDGIVEVPAEQVSDFVRLQMHFDGDLAPEFEGLLARLEHQYGVGGDA